MIVEIEKVKKGDFIRKVGTKKVYVAKGYDRTNKAYELQAYDNISNFAYLKKGKKVEIGFDF